MEQQKGTMLLNLFSAWRRLGKLQKTAERMADLQEQLEAAAWVDYRAQLHEGAKQAGISID